MTKAELIALGMPENRIKEFQDLYHRDLRKEAMRIVENPGKDADGIRRAIETMIPVICSVSSLRKILSTVTYCYSLDYKEDRRKEEAACHTIAPAPAAEQTLTRANNATV